MTQVPLFHRWWGLSALGLAVAILIPIGVHLLGWTQSPVWRTRSMTYAFQNNRHRFICIRRLPGPHVLSWFSRNGRVSAPR